MFRLTIIVSIVSLTVSLARAGGSEPPFLPGTVAELQSGDWGTSDPKEESLGAMLEKGTGEERLAAARELWKGRSFRYSRAVLKFISEDRPDLAGDADFKKLVESDLMPDFILKETKEGNYVWGAWLAYLRPNPKLMPGLLADLDNPAHRIYTPATILALGKYHDPSVVEKLLKLLDSSEPQIAGDAARALGELNATEAESELIKALSSADIWLRVNASSALGKVGTRKAIPELTKLAEFKGYTGAINIRGVAKLAIEQIIEREDPVPNPQR